MHNEMFFIHEENKMCFVQNAQIMWKITWRI